MAASPCTNLPATEPDAAKLSDVRGSDFLPFALYNLDNIAEEDLKNIATELEGDRAIGTGPDTIHLVRAAPASESQQDTIGDAFATHMKSCISQHDALEYYPFGLLVAHDRDWSSNGIFLVHVDFEEPYKVTAFRLLACNASIACDTVRNDDVGIEQIQELYEIK